MGPYLGGFSNGGRYSTFRSALVRSAPPCSTLLCFFCSARLGFFYHSHLQPPTLFLEPGPLPRAAMLDTICAANLYTVHAYLPETELPCSWYTGVEAS